VKVVPLKDALSLPLAFDHRQIIADYIATYHPSLLSINTGNKGGK
jgi:hypothetical protein